VRPIVAILFAFAPSCAALDMEPIYLGSPYMYGWVPDDVETLRGAVVLDGWKLDSRWREACKHWGYALLRVNTDKYEEQLDEDDPEHRALAEGRVARAKAVAHGLRVLGERTGHPELGHVPLVTSGYSRYSGPAQALVEHFPDRVVCFLTGFGPSGQELTDKIRRQEHSWLETPSQFLACEWENLYSGGDKSTILDRQWRRAPGVLRMMGVTWRVYHNPANYHDLGIVFVDRCIAARVPEDWDPADGAPALHPVREEDGWLGSHEGWAIPVEEIPETWNEHATIAPVAEFDGDPRRASWLLDETVAWTWRAFNSRHSKARIVAPGHPMVPVHEGQSVGPTLHLELGLQAEESFPVEILCDEAGVASLEVFAGTDRIGEGDEFTGGESAFGSTRKATCTIEVTIAEPGIHPLMARYTTDDGRQGWTRPVPVVVRRGE